MHLLFISTFVGLTYVFNSFFIFRSHWQCFFYWLYLFLPGTEDNLEELEDHESIFYSNYFPCLWSKHDHLPPSLISTDVFCSYTTASGENFKRSAAVFTLYWIRVQPERVRRPAEEWNGGRLKRQFRMSALYIGSRVVGQWLRGRIEKTKKHPNLNIQSLNIVTYNYFTTRHSWQSVLFNLEKVESFSVQFTE